VFHTVEFDVGDPIPELAPFDLLLVMGGPMDVWQEDEYPWLMREKIAIRRWVADLDRPYFGVCLGHQLLADALGGKVGPMPIPEIGVNPIHVESAAAEDPLFAPVPSPILGLQWHGAQVLDPPGDTVILAANEHSPIQAMRVGERAWGVQFHCEVDETTTAEWAAVPAYQEALHRIAGPDGVPWLAAQVAEHLGTMQATTAALAGALVELCPRP
jgi:GMP synthase-like glutamine amidotransferase